MSGMKSTVRRVTYGHEETFSLFSLLYLYSRHGNCVSSSDGSSLPCHIYISLCFVHLPLFSFLQTPSSFFPEAFSVFVLKMTSFLPLQAAPLGPRGGVFDSLVCNYGPLSASHLKLHGHSRHLCCFLSTLFLKIRYIYCMFTLCIFLDLLN